MLALICAFFISNVIGAVAGFGSIVVGISLAAFFVDITTIVPVVVPIDLFACGYLAWRDFKHIHWQELIKRILPFALIGLFISRILPLAGHETLLKISFGVFILGFGAINLHKEFRRDRMSCEATAKRNKQVLHPLKPGTRGKGIFLLISGGVMQGIFACGGPMIVSDVSRRIRDKLIFRSTLSLLWVILNSVLMVKLYFESQITVQTLTYSAYLFPSMVLGIMLGVVLHDKVSEKSFRRSVFSMLCVSGLALVWSK